MRLSPLDPVIGQIWGAIATAHFFAGRYDEASSWAEKAVRERPSPQAFRLAAASDALAGRLEKAKEAMARLRQLDPHRRISNLKDQYPVRKPEDLARLEDGLRKAGLPE
jgi:tetratricopeptide (TPR) repeat protein